MKEKFKGDLLSCYHLNHAPFHTKNNKLSHLKKVLYLKKIYDIILYVEIITKKEP